ncbi:Thiosulfate sulfurtransferase PspE precursor [Enhygromyxa salina]|uniref:Thiosulfate sulfurtransferase PspE n=1 Tax=Enhygromyxa salina TaxID=215803 RepID=A0A2S9YDC8_9BACT|nr:rhodanese-like domain-containing protein [Enhygromyxa salina]PRQ03021.1 Thiosulfate sulfurtransferase PspE precursor [Enhygromyxa salina]
MTPRVLPAALALALLLPACKHDQDTETTAKSETKLDAQGLPEGPYADRDPALAKQLVDADALLLDVRTPKEFARGHIEGAININHSDVPARLDEIRELVGGDVHKPVVLYCKSGRRAGIVKDQLIDAGFDRVTNLGRLSDWPD